MSKMAPHLPSKALRVGSGVIRNLVSQESVAEQVGQALWENRDSDTIPGLKDLLCSGEMERGRLFS